MKMLGKITDNIMIINDFQFWYFLNLFSADAYIAQLNIDGRWELFDIAMMYCIEHTEKSGNFFEYFYRKSKYLGSRVEEYVGA
jgi:hypothetical protein